MNMEELARIAGVSKSAVSLALSGKPGVGRDTRERILQLANEYGYSNKGRTSAGEMNGKSLQFIVFTNTGLVHEDYYQQPFFRELIHYTEERCRLKGYSLLFSTIDEHSYEQGIRAIAEDNRSSGAILLGTNLDSMTIREIADKLPNLVVLDTCFDHLPVHFVEINNFMGAYQAGKYLLQMGHHNIGYIASDERIHNFDERKRGFNTALSEDRVQIPEDHSFAVAPTMFSSQESLRSQLEQFLSRGKELPSAFFCECDYIAISAMKTLSELGYSIPEDVSVVGFDNINESMIMTPELTTIHVEKERMAQIAVDLLTSMIRGNSPISTKVKVDTLFVERKSCAPAAEL
ncbi:LacI family DNA-binding transcriptional regulator [Neobacillus mesonae]|nr:LacI family DNA-binding transcriptional regulator [Neobacillus mesonae]